MVAINNISYFIGSRPLYENASLHIKPEDKIALIGKNGTGKSTLLRLIVGEYKTDKGDISKSSDCTIGFLNQDLLSYESEESILHVAMTAFEKQLTIQKKIEQILHEMETNYQDEQVEQLAKLQEEFGMLDGYTIESKAEEILEGLGFKTEDLHKPLKSFSGGWRMRVILAKILLQKPSLLLLDEPTNHLDLPSIEWVENYVENYDGAVVIVSHDRQFLDNCTNVTVEVSGAQLNRYEGNYTYFVEEKALRQEIQKGAFENQQAMIRQTERFIERFKAKASKSRQVQSRVKMLERIDMIDDVEEDNVKVYFKFNFSQQPGKIIMSLKNVSKSYPGTPILSNTSATIERGDKIALIGANGKGKSTLLRIVAGTETMDGEREPGYNVKTTFFAQHQLEALNLNNEILEELKQGGSNKLEVELRTILGCFLFKNDEVYKKIKVLSGGEKSRVALAKCLISESNFLLLDEPTNHLDMVSVNVLIQALQQYEGTFLVVSHDRHFVNAIANKIWYIEDQEIKEYPAGYEEFDQWYKERQASKKDAIAAKPEPAKKEVKSLTPESEVQQKIKLANKKLSNIEAEIAAIEKEINEIEKQLSEPKTIADREKFKSLQVQHSQTIKQLEQKNYEWDIIAEEIGELENIKS
ncbi:MAG: ABC-F family ATP-binding cassette domain-containing protein [Cytophagales bacterium]|nr:ABC-F family ATP-binding cassette domain-containing protein [Cytophagales bacterium]